MKKMPVRTRSHPKSPAASHNGSDYRDNSFRNDDEYGDEDLSDSEESERFNSFGSNKSPNLRRRPLHQSPPSDLSNLSGSGFSPDRTSSPREPKYDWDQNSPSPSKVKRIYPNLSTVSERSFDSSRSSSRSGIGQLNLTAEELVKAKKRGREREFNNCLFLVLVLLPSVLGFYLLCRYVLFVKAEPVIVEPNANVRLFESMFKTVQDTFPAQEKRSWRTVKAAVKRVLEDKPEFPATLLFAARKSQKVELECIISKLANTIMQSFNSKETLTISGLELAKLDSKNAKLKLDDTLSLNFKNEQCKVAIITNGESFNSGIVEMLHSYCDHENAPFKDVVIILTFYVDDNVLLNERDLDDHIGQRWAATGMDTDKVAAILSRVANSKVMILKESQPVLQHHCRHILRK